MCVLTEYARSHSGAVLKCCSFVTLVGAIASLLSTSVDAQKLPQGGSVVSGQATIGTPSNGGLIINQTTNSAIINWDSFSVGQNARVSFTQPSSSSAVLNRVTGATNSTIAGNISANGQVYLVNPNGIAITPSGSVQVGGGFVGSALDISNSDFNAGRLNFYGKGNSASVNNAGAISAGTNGFVGLIGGTISNRGTITVPLGKVGLGSGEQITLDPTGDGFLQVAVPTGVKTANGQALIDVAGVISTHGGSIEIKAATAQQAVRDAVNVSGALSARSASGRSGSIILEGGYGGNVIVNGALKAVGGNRKNGGSVTVTGRNIELRGALVDVSGDTGGGTVEIGGGPKGVGPLQTAITTTVDRASTIKADAGASGNGGNVTIWSDGTTQFGGHISARGGSLQGNGGQAEVSGKTHLELTGDYRLKPLADLSALRGKTGTLLFDPGTIDISSVAGSSGPDTFSAQFISTQLATANVTIDTNTATGANGVAGDINLLSNAQIAWNSNNILTLNAARDINFALGASITGTGSTAGLVMRADSGGSGFGTVNFTGGTQVSLPTGSVDLSYNPASNRPVANGGTNNAAGIVNATSYTGTPPSETWSSFVTAGALRAWNLVNNVFDLQNINNNLSANYSLGANIDASATSGWNSGAGFVPLGTNGAGGIIGGGNGFTGSFNGAGNTIDSLTINRPTANNVGLFGYVSSGGQIANTGLTNTVVTAHDIVGGLVGSNNGGSISNSFVSATINAHDNVGGLVGVNTSGTISTSFATGSITAHDVVGGLVGFNQTTSSITDTYATNSITAHKNAGGLVGQNDTGSSISSSYAAGAVDITASESGGFVGNNKSSITSSYFDNQTTGWVNGAGKGSSAGITGLSTAALQNGSLPAGFSATIWTASPGSYPQLTWQSSAAPATQTVIKVIAIDSVTGTLVYGSPVPVFGYSVTDTNGNTLCTTNCSAYFSGSPVIDTSYTPMSAANNSYPGYIVQGTIVAQSGYSIQYVSDSLAVTPRPMTITASGQSKLYGSAAILGTSAFTTSGLVNNDSVTGATLTSPGSSATASVAGGPYAITPSAAVGSGLSNYTIGYINGQLTVNPAPIDVTAVGGNSAYGSSPSNPGLSATGLQNSDNVGALTGLSNSFGITNTTNAGSYLMNVVGSLTNSNYIVNNLIGQTWSVNPASVNVTALGGSSTYGSSPSNPGLSATGLQNGDNVGALTGLSNSFGITNTTNAGSYLMNVVGSLTNSNYVVANLIGQTWSVNPASVNVTALGGSSIYGSSPSNPGLSATGLQNGENVSVLTGLSNSFGIINTTNAGSYMMNVVGSLTNSNYVVNNLVSQTWSVNPASITVTALGGSSNYGASPANPGLSATGLQNSETVSVLTGLRNSFGVDGTTAPGTYKMNVAGALTNSNYTVTSTKTNDWVVNLRGSIGPGSPTPGTTTQTPPSIDITGSITAPALSQTNAGAAMMRDGGANSASTAAAGNSGLPKNSAAEQSVLPSFVPPVSPVPKPQEPSSMSLAKPGCGTDGGGGASGGCGEAPQVKPAGFIDFALSKLNRVELFRAFDHEYKELTESTNTISASLKTAIAGSSIALTVGFVGWLLRGGALLTALLSSIPVWQHFDPLAILQERRRRNNEDEPASEVDRIFDDAGQPSSLMIGGTA